MHVACRSARKPARRGRCACCSVGGTPARSAEPDPQAKAALIRSFYRTTNVEPSGRHGHRARALSRHAQFHIQRPIMSQIITSEHLSVGDIVSFRFPSAEGNHALEKRRPCLVIEADDTTFTVAYGTSSRRRSTRGTELAIRLSEDWSSAGLRKPTRFVANRRVRVPADSARLVRSRSGTARIGKLPDGLLPRLEHIRTRLLAEGSACGSCASQSTRREVSS